MKKFFIWCIKFFLYIFVHLPLKVQWAVGDFFGILWYDIFRIRRDVLRDNIKIAFPEWSKRERDQLARRSCCHMGRNLVEFARFPFLNPEKNKKDFIINGLENLSEARSKGRGVCLLTLHLGNGDLAAAGMALHGIPITVISKEFKVAWLNDLWFGVRAKVGTRFISPRNSSFAILKSLKRKEVVAFVLDQFMGPPIGVRTQFFGVETGTAMGLAVMAHRSGAPVIPTYHYRNAEGRTVVSFEPEIPFLEKEDYDQSIAEMTQVYTNKIEEFIRKYPEQWMWVHRRWKEFRE